MITYCTNIHPGESWADTLANLKRHLPEVKSAVSPGSPFPVGLRLSNAAAGEIDEREAAAFLDWCEEHQMFIPTINGFPYGSFHYSAVKESVYLPDWSDARRAEYTKRLADLLDFWLPSETSGSISTVPIGFRRHISGEAASVRNNIMDTLEHLDRLRQKSGKTIILSLEPEPGCVLETTEDAIAFIDRMKLPADLRDFIGICFDCCHHAVQFEDPAVSLARLAEAGVRIGKFQISSALRMERFDRSTLERFVEPVYLHQTAVRRANGDIARYDDLPAALQSHHAMPGDEWRVHFHLPVFAETIGAHQTTGSFIEKAMPFMKQDALLEVETYTWNVLPEELQLETVTASIIREIEWVKSRYEPKFTIKPQRTQRSLLKLKDKS